IVLASGGGPSLIEKAENLAGIGGVDGARGREPYSSSRALHQRDAQVAGERRDGRRYRRFSDVETLGRAPDRPRVGQRHETAQPPITHGRSPCPLASWLKHIVDGLHITLDRHSKC